MINLRRRKRSEGPLNPLDPLEDGHPRCPEDAMMFTQSRFYTLLLAIISLYGIVYLAEYNMPTPLMMSDEPQNPGRFIAERAKLHVTHLTSLGPRPVGSLANEVLAVKYLMKSVTAIQAQASSHFTIEIDQQVVSGEFPLQFLDGLTSVYRNIQNLIVKVKGKSSSGSAILLNCHYDSVVDSPGGTDDLAACAVLLEVLRVVTSTDAPLRNDLVFLFNGAEENLLQGSHGFITQHKWAKDLIAVINMDACGAGGRELLFQIGPNNPWLLEVYAQAVRYPAASITAQEVFQSGLIPGDTDYRIFRDFGRIPGFDFAWAMGGYMYHTKLDSGDYVPLSSLQHAGENILPLTRRMANVNCPAECDPEGTMVFFDLLHLYLFRITKLEATCTNCLFVFVSCFILYWNSGRTPFTGRGRRRQHFYLVVSASIFLVIAWAAAVLFNVLLASSFYFLNRSMSWFSRPVWIYFLYGIPAVFIPLQIVIMSTEHLKKAMRTSLNWPVFSLYVDAVQLLMTIFIVVGIVTNVGSIFLVTVNAIFYLLANLAKNWAHQKRAGKKWLHLYALCLFFPCLMVWYISHVLFKTVIPIMGRAGSGPTPEIVVSVLTSSLVLAVAHVLVPTVFLFRQNRTIVKNLSIIFVCSILVLFFTPLSFPYSSCLLSPSPQRYTVLHTHRTYYGVKNTLLSERSGFWIVDLDANSPHSVKSFVPEFANAVPVEDCPHQLYCGLPYKLPVWKLLSKTHWLPGPKPPVYIPANLTLMGTSRIDSQTIKMKIKAEGPDHMRIMISPVEGVRLSSWSFANGTVLPGATWGKRQTYFIYYSYASYPGPLTFWLQLKVDDPAVSTALYHVDVAVTGHFLHGPHQKSVTLTKLLAQFPPWTVTSGWVATYTSYKF